MNKDDFLKEQFHSLREEIKETKGRMYRTMGFGIIAIPAANYLASTNEITVLTLALPILIIVVSLLYLAESNALMRCGRYVKNHIEREVEGVVGWEQFLETKSQVDARATDKYLSYAFFLLFILYFLAAVWMAITFAHQELHIFATAALLAIYIFLGACFILLLILRLRTNTSD